MKLLCENIEEATVIKESAGNGKQHYFLEGIFLQGDIQNRNGRKYPFDILNTEVGRYKRDYIDRRRAFGEFGHPSCMKDTVCALSNTGWKLIKDFKEGDFAYTINPETETIELQPVRRVVDQPYVGSMIEFDHRTFKTSVTPNHRFLIKNYHTGEKRFVFASDIQNYLDGGESDLSNKWYIPRSHQGAKQATTRTIRVGSRDFRTEQFAAFLGLYLAEGSTTHRKGRGDSYVIGIYQNEGEKGNKIRELLSAMDHVRWSESNKDGMITWKCHDLELAKYLYPLGNCYDKYVPAEIISVLDTDTAAIFWDWFCLGDGRGDRTRKDYSRCDIFSTSHKLAEDLSQVAAIAGYTTYSFTEVTTEDYVFAGRNILAKAKKPLHFTRLIKSIGIYLDRRHLKAKTVPYRGNVCCLTTDNGTFLAREAGYTFWTGNSPTIQMERISHIITKLDPDGRNFIGRAKIIDEGYGKIARSLIDEGALLAMSSRGVGSVTTNNGISVVGKDFQLSTAADIVADPSAPDAFVEGVMENAEWVKMADGSWKRQFIKETKSNIYKANRTSPQEVERVLLNAFDLLIAKISRV